MRKHGQCLLVFGLFILFSKSVYAQCSEQQGRALAAKLESATEAWKGLESELEMKLVNKNGKSNTYTLSSKTLKTNVGFNNLLEFQAPISFSGTKLLSKSFTEMDDEQWVYLAKTRKTKRIKGKSRKSNFLGSQFTFEDLSGFTVSNYRYNLLEAKECGGNQPCQRLEAYINYPGSAYFKLILWIDVDFRIQKIEYIDLDHEHIKTMEIKAFEKISEEVWQPSHSVMTNHKNGKSTELLLKTIQMNDDLDAKWFEKL